MRKFWQHLHGVVKSFFIAVIFLGSAVVMDAVRKPHVEHDRDAQELVAIEKDERQYRYRREQILAFLDATADATTRKNFGRTDIPDFTKVIPVATQSETDRYRAAMAAEYVEWQRRSQALGVRKEELKEKADESAVSNLFHGLDVFSRPGTQAYRIYDVLIAGAVLVGFFALASVVVLCFGSAFGMTETTIKDALTKLLPPNVSSALMVATLAGTTAAVAAVGATSSLDWTPTSSTSVMSPPPVAADPAPPTGRGQNGPAESSPTSFSTAFQYFGTTNIGGNSYFDTTKYFTECGAASCPSNSVAGIVSAIDRLATAITNSKQGASDAPAIRVLQKAVQDDLRRFQAAVTAGLASIEEASEANSGAMSKQVAALTAATKPLDDKLAAIVEHNKTAATKESIAAGAKTIADASGALAKLSADLLVESKCVNKRLDELSRRNAAMLVLDTVRGARIVCPPPAEPVVKGK